VKNLELIDHSEKLRLLNIGFKGWAKLLLFGLYVLEELFVEGEIAVGDLKIMLKRPENVKEFAFFRQVLFVVPTVVAELVKSEMGTEKLEMQLRALPFDGKELSEEFLRGALYGELQLPERLSQLRKTVDRIKAAPFLLEAFAIRLREMFFRLNDGEKAEIMAFQRFVAEVRAVLMGETESQNSINKEIQRLETLRNTRRLKDDRPN
jgi:hypothetical protein